MDIRIVCGIPDGKRRDISALIYSVDPVIFRRIFGKDALNILEASLNDKMIFVAMIEDKVAGVVGIASKEERSLNVTPAVVLKYRGIKFLKSLLLWQLIKSMPGKGDLFIEFIAVESRYRGRGIGTKLLNRAIAFACENGLEKVRLFVREDNTNARKLYEKLGFTVEKSVRVPFPLNRLLSIERGYKMVLPVRKGGSRLGSWKGQPLRPTS